MNFSIFRDWQRCLFRESRAIYYSGETAQSQVQVEKVKDAVNKELIKGKPFEMAEYQRLANDADECLGIKNLSKTVIDKAEEIAISEINGNPKIKDPVLLIQHTFTEVKSYLQTLNAKVVALKAKKMLSGRNKRVAEVGLEVASESNDIIKILKKIRSTTEGSTTTAVISTNIKGEHAITESAKVMELVKNGVITPEEAYKIGFKVEVGLTGDAKKVMELIKTGVITEEDAAKIGLKVETVKIVPAVFSKLGISLKSAERLTKVVHFAGRVAIVVDAALSVYDVYDQAKILGQLLSSDYNGSVVGAAASIVDHTTDIELTRGAKKEVQDRQRLEETDLSRLLLNTRSMATNLVFDATSFGVKYGDMTKRSNFEKVENVAENVLGAPTQLLAGAILGTPDDKRLLAEKKTIEGSIESANKMLGIVSAKSRNQEVEKTGEALTEAINLARKALNQGKPVTETEANKVIEMIRGARPIPKPRMTSA